ncbi:MAG: hypothetical protein ACRC8A_20470 [Microcoleaceae cyanobacterium]
MIQPDFQLNSVVNSFRLWARLLTGLLTAASLNLSARPTLAQTPCTPPGAGEYLVLVVSETTSAQELTRRSLPQDVNSGICRYLEDTVTRVGGFSDRLIAQDWASYITANIGLRAYVVKPDNNTQAPAPEISRRPPNPANSTVADLPPSNSAEELSKAASTPEAMSTSEATSTTVSYAILVDYLNQPELAAQVERIVGRKIGLASYGQRSYLLVESTRDLEKANSILQTLSRQGFWSFVVDGQRVTVIRSEINPQ